MFLRKTVARRSVCICNLSILIRLCSSKVVGLCRIFPYPEDSLSRVVDTKLRAIKWQR